MPHRPTIVRIIRRSRSRTARYAARKPAYSKKSRDDIPSCNSNCITETKSGSTRYGPTIKDSNCREVQVLTRIELTSLRLKRLFGSSNISSESQRPTLSDLICDCGDGVCGVIQLEIEKIPRRDTFPCRNWPPDGPSRRVLFMRESVARGR